MDHVEDRTWCDGTNCYPTLFLFNRIVSLRNGEWIVKHENGSLKTHIMLAEISPVLVFIPLKAHVKRAIV
jgi:hypothetical protein